jgi:trk system potassium uptake protein TrkH
VCVTGLTALDTGKDYTLAGQLVILGLIQLGGLGILTFSTSLMLALGRRLSLKGAETFTSSFGMMRELRLRDLAPRVLLYTFTIEGAGALLLWARFAWRYPPLEAFYYAVFHSISAFCNAGFSLFSDSLTQFRADPVVNGVVMALILSGGLGFLVLVELNLWWRQGRKAGRRLSLHSRLALQTSALLVLWGAFAIALLEASHTWRAARRWKRCSARCSSRSRRAPRASYARDFPSQRPALCVMMALMFVGASPGSCGGGVKTTTFAVLLGIVVSRARGRSDTEIHGRRISPSQVSKALATFAAALCAFALIFFALQITEAGRLGTAAARERFLDLAFESVSALGTVGLSMGVTPELSVAGRMVIALAMFAGRLGPLTLAFSMVGERRSGARYTYPEESVLVG